MTDESVLSSGRLGFPINLKTQTLKSVTVLPNLKYMVSEEIFESSLNQKT